MVIKKAASPFVNSCWMYLELLGLKKKSIVLFEIKKENLLSAHPDCDGVSRDGFQVRQRRGALW